MNVIYLEFVCAGRCSACVKGKRGVEYCRLLKEHKDDKAGVCASCYKTQPGQSVTQCRKVLGHKGPNALTTDSLVVPTCSEEENAQRCVSSGFTPCCAELVSFSTVGIHPDARTSTSNEGSDRYGLGYLSPFSKKRWEEWRRKYSLQSGIDYRAETGNQTNSKDEHGVAYCDGSRVSYQIKSTQLYNCSRGGRRRLKPEVKNCSKRRNAPGSRKLGCQATMHTKLLQLSSGQMVLEVQIPTLKTHLSTHDPKSIFDELSHEPLPEIEEKVYSLVQGAYLTQMALILAVRDWVKKELIPKHLREGVITTAPSDYSRAYFPTKEDIRYMARRAIVQQRSSLLDQDAVENYLRETKEHQELDFYLHKYKVSPKG